MVLRICALLSLLVAMAAAQMDMMDDNDTTMMPPGEGMMDMDFVANITAQFMGEQSAGERRRHFYCLEPNQNRRNFPYDLYNDATGTLLRNVTWAVFLQYPVLSYLDSIRKEYLFQVIIDVAQSQSGGRLAGLNTSHTCISRVFHYRVSEYEESVLINVYFREGNGIVETPLVPANMTNGLVSIQDFNTYFDRGVRMADTSNPTSRVRLFRDKRALAINSVATEMSRFSMTEMNVHPFGLTDREDGVPLDPDDDPTLRAIVISSYPGQRDLTNVTYDSDAFATNPRPINFGLEAGDIVFIVFGCIFLLIVMALTVLGFCIHPFFLA